MNAMTQSSQNSGTETIARLRQLKIAPSPQRVAIFNYLRQNPVHPTADMIFQALRGAMPTMSLTTVYNTLKLLSARGGVQEVIIEDGELRFDADMREHAHCKCVVCGKVLDLFPPAGERLLATLPEMPEDFVPTEVHLCFRGRCREHRDTDLVS